VTLNSPRSVSRQSSANVTAVRRVTHRIVDQIADRWQLIAAAENVAASPMFNVIPVCRRSALASDDSSRSKGTIANSTRPQCSARFQRWRQIVTRRCMFFACSCISARYRWRCFVEVDIGKGLGEIR
jgi:hypothetical protein